MTPPILICPDCNQIDFRIQLSDTHVIINCMRCGWFKVIERKTP